uniref:Uncharacterized protein n=1 Tax=Glossina austeni TaxID=7395 RepID=A0A1A9V0U9_GLOAU
MVQYRFVRGGQQQQQQQRALNISYAAGNDFGPYGDYDEQVFVQKVIPETDQLYLRLASNGDRVCVIKSVDGSSITSFCVHGNGNVQMCNLTTALALFSKKEENRTQKINGDTTPTSYSTFLTNAKSVIAFAQRLVCHHVLQFWEIWQNQQ